MDFYIRIVEVLTTEIMELYNNVNELIREFVRINNACTLFSSGRHDYYHILYTVTWAFLAVFLLVRWSGLSDQDILLEYNTLKGVYQLLSDGVV